MNVKMSFKQFQAQTFEQSDRRFQLTGAYVQPLYEGHPLQGRVMHSAVAVTQHNGKCVAVWVRNAGVVWAAKGFTFTEPERKHHVSQESIPFQGPI